MNQISVILPINFLHEFVKYSGNPSYRDRDVCHSIKSIEIYSLARNTAIVLQVMGNSARANNLTLLIYRQLTQNLQHLF